MKPYALILTDGKPGHENQSKALAEGLGLSFDLMPCTYTRHWKKMLSYLLDKLHIYRSLTGVVPATRCPAVIIGTGSNTFYTLKYLKRWYKGKVPVVAILTPSGYRMNTFDLILSPAFDQAKPRANLMTMPTNLTPLRESYYKAQTEAFLARYTPVKPTSVGIIIGGANAIADVTAPWLAEQMKLILAATPEAEHWVTTSRRTSKAAEAVLRALPLEYKLLFSEDHFNPIPAFVSRCETLFVTAESTGMLSEAVAQGTAAVEVLDNLTSQKGKFARFVEHLCAEGYAHRFDGTLGKATKKVDSETLFATIRQKLQIN